MFLAFGGNIRDQAIDWKAVGGVVGCGFPVVTPPFNVLCSLVLHCPCFVDGWRFLRIIGRVSDGSSHVRIHWFSRCFDIFRN
jgi:hypothetical protein